METVWPCWIALLLHFLLRLHSVVSLNSLTNSLPNNDLLLLCSATAQSGLPLQEFTYHSLRKGTRIANPCGQHTGQSLCCACGVKVLHPSLAQPTHNQLAMHKIFSLHDSESHFEVTNLVFTSEYLSATQKSRPATRVAWSDLKEVMLWPKGTQISCAHRFLRDLENFITSMGPVYKISESLKPATTIVTLENQKEEEMYVTCADTLHKKKGETFRMEKGSTHEVTVRTRRDIFHACHFRAGKWKFNMVIFIYAYFEPFVGPLNYVGLMEDGLVYSGEFAKHEMQFLWKERPHHPLYPSSLRDELLTDTAKTFVREVF